MQFGGEISTSLFVLGDLHPFLEVTREVMIGVVNIILSTHTSWLTFVYGGARGAPVILRLASF